MLDAFAIGISLGLAILTKATAYLYALPFAIWWSVNAIRPFDVKRVKLLALSLLIAITINLPNYSRNYNLFSSPLGPSSEAVKYTNDIFSLPSFLSNVVRNVAMHAQSPSVQLNELVTDGLIRFHTLIRMSVNDNRTTWPGTTFQAFRPHDHEDSAGNPLHVLLILFAMGCVLVKHRDPTVLRYVICWLFGFLIFCLYLKWQPWHSRLHLPLFVLFAPVAGLTISKLKYRWVSCGIMVFLMLAALPLIFYNHSRPLIGSNNIFSRTRADQYFANQPSLAGPYEKAVHVVSKLGCSQIGLIIGVDDWEYPLWALRSEKMRSTERIEHVLVTNSSAKALSKEDHFVPCCIISTQNPTLEKLTVGDFEYSRLWNQNPVSVYVIEPDSKLHPNKTDKDQLGSHIH
ncbi:MAG: hypothetical protein M0T73_15985 [Deltaproteobacteria bacterium]|nr:hypothetical protein [Deltaproteobacteria bacterium]